METLIIIDPQNDFCDKKGSLYVRGAEEALENIVEYIRREKPSHIIVTLDTHSPLHMDLPGGWNRTFDELPCFNPDPKDSEYEESANLLLRMGYPLVVWPNHCLRGSWGHAVSEPLMSVLVEWQIETGCPVEFIEKGLEDHQEMYSAFSYLGSQKVKLPEFLKRRKNKVMMVGFALDYCVKYSYLDLKKEGVSVKLFLPGTAAIGEVEEYWKGK